MVLYSIRMSLYWARVEALDITAVGEHSAQLAELLSAGRPLTLLRRARLRAVVQFHDMRSRFIAENALDGSFNFAWVPPPPPQPTRA